MSFFENVYKIVKKIPPGKVATYGQIAQILDSRDTRKVGWALHANNDKDVPCHRVVNKSGNLAENFAFDGWREQKSRLLAEGIRFADKKRVDSEKHLWDGLAE